MGRLHADPGKRRRKNRKPSDFVGDYLLLRGEGAKRQKRAFFTSKKCLEGESS